jgi:hypothetical protein
MQWPPLQIGFKQGWTLMPLLRIGFKQDWTLMLRPLIESLQVRTE